MLSFTQQTEVLTELQTYKGWFYVIITALLFYVIIKKHLNKLRNISSELKEKNNALVIASEKLLNSSNELSEAIKKAEISESELTFYKENLEKIISERTEDLEKKNKELEHFNNLFINREFRIKELKDELNALKNRLKY
ncbi:MAG: hypothetical protein JXR31_12045 [Prolixibacteraceae bacterium]|nr:hypothetical protein [Prolixibacteraceae bacterium]